MKNCYRSRSTLSLLTLFTISACSMMFSKLTPRFANILMISNYERGHGVMFEPSGWAESGEQRILQQPGCLINTKLGSYKPHT